MSQPWRVLATATVLVLGVSCFLPAGLVAVLLNAVYQFSEVAIKLLAPPGPPQQMFKAMAEQYVSPLALRDFNATSWTLLGVYILLVIAVALIDATLKRWNDQLADMAMISSDMVQHYSGTSYEKALLVNAVASNVRRAN
ncbi:membrane-associated protein, putative [Bodo saltans]|uniref:Membrane-associated protein, putative n=1 Tax=Bodo saltans TaxID=75058 RepID=A0A0S4KI58_BODSA|nr:membrane-associated protein, putative [Bodo saltans]|eukprot:CUI14822.1 membrane-associated protein, putative [Bodo saltans]